MEVLDQIFHSVVLCALKARKDNGRQKRFLPSHQLEAFQQRLQETLGIFPPKWPYCCFRTHFVNAAGLIFSLDSWDYGMFRIKMWASLCMHAHLSVLPLTIFECRDVFQQNLTYKSKWLSKEESPSVSSPPRKKLQILLNNNKFLQWKKITLEMFQLAKSFSWTTSNNSVRRPNFLDTRLPYLCWW